MHPPAVKQSPRRPVGCKQLQLKQEWAVAEQVPECIVAAIGCRWPSLSKKTHWEEEAEGCVRWAWYHALVSTGTANADTCHVQRHRWLLLSILASPPHSAYSAQERPTAEAASELLA